MLRDTDTQAQNRRKVKNLKMTIARYGEHPKRPACADGMILSPMSELQRRLTADAISVFTGMRFHKNWGNESFRKVVLNGILWIAKVEVPPNGVECRVTES